MKLLLLVLAVVLAVSTPLQAGQFKVGGSRRTMFAPRKLRASGGRGVKGSGPTIGSPARPSPSPAAAIATPAPQGGSVNFGPASVSPSDVTAGFARPLTVPDRR